MTGLFGAVVRYCTNLLIAFEKRRKVKTEAQDIACGNVAFRETFAVRAIGPNEKACLCQLRDVSTDRSVRYAVTFESDRRV